MTRCCFGPSKEAVFKTRDASNVSTKPTGTVSNKKSWKKELANYEEDPNKSLSIYVSGMWESSYRQKLKILMSGQRLRAEFKRSYKNLVIVKRTIINQFEAASRKRKFDNWELIRHALLGQRPVSRIPKSIAKWSRPKLPTKMLKRLCLTWWMRAKQTARSIVWKLFREP